MKKQKRWIIPALVLGLGAGTVVWRVTAVETADMTPPPPTAVTVVAAKVISRDIPVWLSGIGTVQAYNTVVVRPRVSGTLEQIEFTEGSPVEKDEILARIDPRPYEATLALATARKAQNEALLVSAKRDSTRMELLVKSQSVSEQALEQASALVAQLEAAIEADVASIASAQLDLDFTTVRAPIAGRTGIRHLDAGNLVTANQSEGLVHLTQLQPVSVIFTLPQQHFSALRAHMGPGVTSLKVEATSDDGTVLDTGELELVDNQIDLATGTLRLKARFANEDLTLWPGQFVSARVLVETRKGAIVVPTEVIQPGLDGPFAYLIRDDETVEARNLTTGLSLEGWTVVEKGLVEGDKVVREGQNKLKPGARVKSRELPL